MKKTSVIVVLLAGTVPHVAAARTAAPRADTASHPDTSPRAETAPPSDPAREEGTPRSRIRRRAEPDGTIVVTGRALPGGAIARDSNLGLLGAGDIASTPFSVTSYSSEYIRNIQAHTLGDVLESSPGVTRFGGRFNGNDNFFIRGFLFLGLDVAYDGLYGLSSVRHNGFTGVDRIELLKGPNALLNGVPPNGAIGGSVNLVPKRAGAAPISDLSIDYLSPGNIGGSADLGRRFGADGAFGARLNVMGRDGDTEIDYGREREINTSLALDYRIGRLRLYADLNYQTQRMKAAVFAGFNLDPGLAVPKAPRASINPDPPFTYTSSKRDFEVARAEYDVAPGWTAAIAYGHQTNHIRQFVNYGPTIFDAAGDVREADVYRLARQPVTSNTIDAKLRGTLHTGPIDHRIALAAYQLVVTDRFSQLNAGGSDTISNIYDYSVDYGAPDFTGLPRGTFPDRLRLRGVAVADTLSALDDRIQLTAGVRRQTIRDVDPDLGTVFYSGSAWSPAFAVLIKPVARLSLYANAIQALSQAPSPPDNAINFTDKFPPAKSKQKEAGAKYDTGRAIVTLALFDIRQPSGVLDPRTKVFSVSGDERHRGIELEGYGEVAHGVRVIGGISYMHARLEKTDGGVNQGNRPFNVPAWNVSLASEWDPAFLRGFTLTGRVVHSGNRYLDAENTQRVPDWTRVDAGARYGFRIGRRPLTARIEITNLFDRNYWESAYGSLVTGSPRAIALSLATSL